MEEPWILAEQEAQLADRQPEAQTGVRRLREADCERVGV